MGYTAFLEQHLSTSFSNSIDKQQYELEINRYKDAGYISFLKSYPAGAFFFSNALQIYGCPQTSELNQISAINSQIHNSYSILSTGLQFFASDIFGNQFCFKNDHIHLFNLESGELTFLANSFADFVDILKEDSEFTTGKPYKQQYELEKGMMLLAHKIRALKPFVIGGDYKIENFVATDFNELVIYNSKIAHQIHNLPNGTEVIISFEA